MAKQETKPTNEDELIASSGAELTHPYVPTDTRVTASRPVGKSRFPLRTPLRRITRMRWWPYLALIGPGIIAGSAGNDAGGIATYASTGATYGYQPAVGHAGGYLLFLSGSRNVRSYGSCYRQRAHGPYTREIRRQLVNVRLARCIHSKHRRHDIGVCGYSSRRSDTRRANLGGRTGIGFPGLVADNPGILQARGKDFCGPGPGIHYLYSLRVPGETQLGRCWAVLFPPHFQLSNQAICRRWWRSSAQR